MFTYRCFMYDHFVLSQIFLVLELLEADFAANRFAGRVHVCDVLAQITGVRKRFMAYVALLRFHALPF